MEKSEVYIVIRWRIYLQSCKFLLRHITGKENIVSDWGIYPLANTEESDDLFHADFKSVLIDCDSMLKQVHDGRMFHHGP